MENKKSNYSALRSMKKSQSQQHLNRRKNAFARPNKLPTLEERKAGGMYALMNQK